MQAVWNLKSASGIPHFGKEQDNNEQIGTFIPLWYDDIKCNFPMNGNRSDEIKTWCAPVWHIPPQDRSGVSLVLCIILPLTQVCGNLCASRIVRASQECSMGFRSGKYNGHCCPWKQNQDPLHHAENKRHSKILVQYHSPKTDLAVKIWGGIFALIMTPAHTMTPGPP